MKRIFAALLFASLAFAAAPDHVNKIVPVKNMDADRLASKISSLTQANIGVESLRMTTVQSNIVLSGPQEQVAAVEQLIKMLDTPEPKARGIEVTGYIILAEVESKPEAANVPADLDPVLKQFHSLLNYKSFRVLDTLILRGKENSPMSSNGFLMLPRGAGSTVGFRVARPSVSDDLVHLKDLILNVRIPTSRVNDKGAVITDDVSMSTDAEMKAGQKVAIGKASVNGNGDAIILVVSAKVVD